MVRRGGARGVAGELADHLILSRRSYRTPQGDDADPKGVAVRRIHRLLALPDPTGREDVRLALRRIKWFRPVRPRPAHGITGALRQKVLANCGDDMEGKRDRAPVALGFEGLCRRSEVSALKVTDLIEIIRGSLSVTIRRGTAEQGGEGRSVGLSGHTAEILHDWIAAARLVDRPLICSVYKCTDSLASSGVPANESRAVVATSTKTP
jgi:integrase